MNADIRLRLDMGTAVRGFHREHPPEDPGQASLVARLGDRLDRAGILLEQQRTGRVTVHASVLSKDEHKLLIRDQLQVLEGAAQLAALDDPGLDARFEPPPLANSHRSFVAGARVCLAQASPMRDLLIKHGMPATFLEELAAEVDLYEQVVENKLTARGAHVGASADLEAVTGEIMLIVRLLDRINRLRYRKNAELLAAWKSARDVAWVNPAPPEAESDEVKPGEETAA
jgi:hypothetical protein